MRLKTKENHHIGLKNVTQIQLILDQMKNKKK
jgi:hypothetical protein